MDGLLNTKSAAVSFKYLLEDPKVGLKNHNFHYFTKERLQKYLKELQGNRTFLMLNPAVKLKFLFREKKPF